jgi:Helix-turn-helix family
MRTPSTALAVELGTITNLTHGFVYFAPEAWEAYAEIGLERHQQYFASRAAPFGPVPAEVVVATFFNFNPDLVRAAIPGAWEAATPGEIQQARMSAAARVLERCCAEIDLDLVEEASTLARAMIDGIGFEGKPLAAANLSVAEPDDAWARFWQRITVLREWRGDVHVAALTAAPVTAVEALILHAATEQVPRAALVATRGWPEEVWQGAVDGLVERGLVNPDESFTDEGRRFREEIEERTDLACAALVDAIGSDHSQRLVELLGPVRRGLIDGGALAMMGR